MCLVDHIISYSNGRYIDTFVFNLNTTIRTLIFIININISMLVENVLFFSLLVSYSIEGLRFKICFYDFM